eukprot:gnl/TRDRNA2_/TRDRNA2_161278_c0_seq1.p1 gnl/TRDRNA2_/TRDRNA2_161278_c0~~gnl/TRDRNA2_/TRDRNA2_161278_c0_seq1.p1  ORF type:complete len:463 (-),score=45.62 gnl/TRDRNA2_/TRDRNA2_161278_c0_seq1:8-1396(-)
MRTRTRCGLAAPVCMVVCFATAVAVANAAAVQPQATHSAGIITPAVSELPLTDFMGFMGVARTPSHEQPSTLRKSAPLPSGRSSMLQHQHVSLVAQSSAHRQRRGADPHDIRRMAEMMAGGAAHRTSNGRDPSPSRMAKAAAPEASTVAVTWIVVGVVLVVGLIILCAVFVLCSRRGESSQQPEKSDRVKAGNADLTTQNGNYGGGLGMGSAAGASAGETSSPSVPSRRTPHGSGPADSPTWPPKKSPTRPATSEPNAPSAFPNSWFANSTNKPSPFATAAPRSGNEDLPSPRASPPPSTAHAEDDQNQVLPLTSLNSARSQHPLLGHGHAVPAGQASFCPSLVVPEGSQCSLLVPVREPGAHTIIIRDVAGKPMLQAVLKSQAVAEASTSPASPSPSLTLMTSFETVLATTLCQVIGTPPSPEFHLYRANGEHFAVLMRDVKNEGYTLDSLGNRFHFTLRC